MHIVSFGRSFLHDNLEKAAIFFFFLGGAVLCSWRETSLKTSVCVCKIGLELLHLPLDGDVAENDSPA